LTPISLESQLQQTSYPDLFERLESPARDAILSRPRAIEQLRQLVSNEAVPAGTRFLGAELLYYAGEADWPDQAARRFLPVVYGNALATLDDGSTWGIPGRWTHPATDHAIALGEPVVPALAPLLDDEKRLRYTGSKRAMLGEHLRIRVKDVAAFIIAGALGVPYPAAESTEDRDAFIAELAARVRG
jgi:hypothetical protein